jgi:PKHD-type hydroxylase
MRGLYKIVKNLLDSSEALELTEIIKKAPMTGGDEQVPKSRSYYSLPVCSILLGRMTQKISELVGKRLRPSYAYCRIYLNGADLKPHKDRPSCEYSVTLNLSQTHPWTIYMGKRGIIQKPGDAVIYKGCEIEHSRNEFDGEEYVQVFLHYVDADGLYSNFVYDKKQEETPVTTYRYLFTIDSDANHVNYYRYIKFIPEDTIDILRSKLDIKELKDATVGNSVIDKVKRRSKVFWLPKTDEFHEIYKILYDCIHNCNRDFYHFKLTEITEDIQYTVYMEETQGYYDWHMDMGPCKARKLSLVCQLSDPSEYEGGELQINNGNIIIPEKDKGTVILFPSYLMHRVTPVTKGTRRSLVIWIEGPPFT